MDKNLHNPTLRVLNILEVIDNNQSKLNLTKISELLNIPKSTISPIIKTLLIKGYIEINKSGLYSTSFRTFQLGLSYGGKKGSLEFIKDIMKDISSEVGEICQLGVLIDDQVLYLEKVNSNESIEIVSSVGTKLPAYATGLGKALLSGLTNDEIKKMYSVEKLEKVSKNTITNIEDLLEELENIRKVGYAKDNEEIMENVKCIAVPIYFKDSVKCAISVTYPLFRDEKNKEEKIIELLLRKKELIESIIDIHGYDFNMF